MVRRGALPRVPRLTPPHPPPSILLRSSENFIGVGEEKELHLFDSELLAAYRNAAGRLGPTRIAVALLDGAALERRQFRLEPVATVAEVVSASPSTRAAAGRWEASGDEIYGGETSSSSMRVVLRGLASLSVAGDDVVQRTPFMILRIPAEGVIE